MPSDIQNRADVLQSTAEKELSAIAATVDAIVSGCMETVSNHARTLPQDDFNDCEARIREVIEDTFAVSRMFYETVLHDPVAAARANYADHRRDRERAA
jgi:phage-related protein